MVARSGVQVATAAGDTHRVASADQGTIVGRPVRDAVFRLVRGMDSRLHPLSVVVGSVPPSKSRDGPSLDSAGRGDSCTNAVRTPYGWQDRVPSHSGALGGEILARIDEPISLKELTRQAVRELERKIILRVLQVNHWNRKKAAKMLNISRRYIAVVGGHASPLKTIRIEQVDADTLRDALNSIDPDG